MAEAVYILCALASMTCSALLLRTYLRSRARLLLWSSLCFIGLALNNILLFLDLVIVPDTDLSILRGLVALASVALLNFGLIWESK